MSNTKVYKGGETVDMVTTAGGHEATVSQQPAFPDFHRKLADPSAFAWLSVAASFVLYGVVLLGGQGVDEKNVTVPAALALGALLLTLATIFEFIAGRTFPATMFGIYSGFFGGVTVLNVGWFGLTGSYTGQTPNTYSTGGLAAAELGDLQGLWISTFVIITPLLFLAATRQSIVVMSFLTSLEVFFILHMVNSFMPNGGPSAPLAKASGAFAILSGIIAWYMAAASLLTSDSAFFTLPMLETIKED